MSTRIGSGSQTPKLIKPRDAKRRQPEVEVEINDYRSPRRAQFNYIPSPDALRTLIDRALEALGKGVYWDRGSIINLLL